VWKPYTIVRDDPEQTEYRYATVCSYWLYGTIAFLVAGLILESPPLYYSAFASIAAYFVVVTLPGFKVAAAIKSAARDAEITISGSRWSWTDPMTFVVRKPPQQPPDTGS